MFDARDERPMRREAAQLAVLALLGCGASAQVPEDVAARLKSPVASERSQAIAALGRIAAPDQAVLALVAESLVDEVEDVRVAAAYSLASVSMKLGCKVDALDECKLLKAVLDSQPKAVKKVPPVYPADARQAHVEGVVRLECLVREDGGVDRIRVVDGPPRLRDAAVEALGKWRYQPAKRRGQAVPFAMVFSVTFRSS